ncbi:NACHT domain-containing protein [Streptoalloteichus hindustanus]|uniref:NACHT domain-containing protein n=1 Tax=Streptoalloteichus hindustanus TaxID=2017 RepID=A0A1M5I1I3_STRHI|nr:NACHT domain-containing protein [Streptoalloteichus hindustanus]SHG21883.1 NACHT domain-containing protein [Streptoalloteichus hindustanus]
MIAEGALRIGQSVAKQLALQWFSEKKADSRRGRDLSRLIGARFPVRRQERDVMEALLKIEDDVARGLEPELARAAHGLPDNEREAALAAVSDALEDSDLSDGALFAVDCDPRALAAAVRRQQPVDRAGLSERAARLYDAALERACVVLIHLVRELPEFEAAVAVETLGRLRTVLERVEQLLERVPMPELSAPSGRLLDDEFRTRYLNSVARSYDQLEVIGLTTHSYEPRTTVSVAYLSLTVTDDAKRGRRDREHFGWRDNDLELDPTTTLRVEVALGDSRLTVVRGEAGAGKSTLLRWLAVNAARSAFTGHLREWNGCVPFMVKLREFATRALPRGDDVLNQPSSPQLGPIPEGWAHRQFDSGRALLLVDGIDELSARRRPAVRTWLRELLASYPQLRVVVTSRPTAITAKWLTHEGFRSVVLEPMTPGDVQVFLRRWHSALLDSATNPAVLPCRPEEVDEHRRTLLAQLQARPHLRALARNPLLCAMLCALNLDRRSRLPRDRVALYSAALDMLLERRDADRNVVAGAEIQASASEKRVLLQVLAWWLNENGRTEMSRDQALARIAERLRGMPNVQEDAETLLDHLIERSGVIRSPAMGRIDFIHRTFQEFLAAREAMDRDSVDLIVRHASSDLWRETVIMACAQGTSEQRGRLLEGLLGAADRASAKKARQLNLLAAACRETAILAPPEVLAQVDERVRTLVPPRSVRESRSLATVGETVLDYLPTDLSTLSTSQAVACVRTATLVNGPRALDTLSGYAADPREELTHELAWSWQYFDPETYARQVLADAPLTMRYPRDCIDVDSRAVPYLHLIKNLHSCRVNLWGISDITNELRQLSRLTKLRGLTVLGDVAPDSLPELSTLQRLEWLFLNFRERWPDSVDFIASLAHIRDLSLVNTWSLRDFAFLRELKRVRKLNLSSPVTNWMDEVAVPERLTDATYTGPSDRYTQKAFVARFPNITRLSFHSKRDTEASRDMWAFARLPLRMIQFYGRGNPNLSGLENCRSLRLIRIDGSCEVDLSPLRELPVRIVLGGRRVTAIGTEQLHPRATVEQL